MKCLVEIENKAKDKIAANILCPSNHEFKCVLYKNLTLLFSNCTHCVDESNVITANKMTTRP